MKKKFLSILPFLIVILAFKAQHFVRYTYLYSNIVKSNWNLELPNKYKEVYSTNDGENFLGDGLRYHVFKYNNSDNVISCLDWKTKKNSHIESTINKILTELKVPEEHMPNLKDKYKYYYQVANDSSVIYIIFNPNTNIIHIIEEFN